MKVAAVAAISPNSQPRSARSQEQTCLNCQKITSNKDEEEKTMLGTEKKEKTEKASSSSPHGFLISGSRPLGYLITLCPFHSLKDPCVLCNKFFSVSDH